MTVCSLLGFYFFTYFMFYLSYIFVMCIFVIMFVFSQNVLLCDNSKYVNLFIRALNREKIPLQGTERHRNTYIVIVSSVCTHIRYVRSSLVVVAFFIVKSESKINIAWDRFFAGYKIFVRYSFI